MNTQRSFLSTFVVIALLATVVVAGLCAYQYLATRAVAREVRAQRDELLRLQEYAEDLRNAHSEGKQLRTQVASQAGAWTWSEQLPVMVQQVSGIVNAADARIDTLQPAPSVEREQLTRFPLRITLQTRLSSLAKILQSIQEATPALAIDQLSMHNGQKPSDPLRVEITLSSYVMFDSGKEKGSN